MHHTHDGTAGWSVVDLHKTGTTGATRQVTDGTGVAVTVPSEPKRIVPIAASTEDIVLSLVDPSRVAAVGTAGKQCA